MRGREARNPEPEQPSKKKHPLEGMDKEDIDTFVETSYDKIAPTAKKSKKKPTLTEQERGEIMEDLARLRGGAPAEETPKEKEDGGVEESLKEIHRMEKERVKAERAAKKMKPIPLTRKKKGEIEESLDAIAKMEEERVKADKEAEKARPIPLVRKKKNEIEESMKEIHRMEAERSASEREIRKNIEQIVSEGLAGETEPIPLTPKKEQRPFTAEEEAFFASGDAAAAMAEDAEKSSDQLKNEVETLTQNLHGLREGVELLRRDTNGNVVGREWQPGLAELEQTLEETYGIDMNREMREMTVKPSLWKSLRESFKFIVSPGFRKTLRDYDRRRDDVDEAERSLAVAKLWLENPQEAERIARARGMRTARKSKNDDRKKPPTMSM